MNFSTGKIPDFSSCTNGIPVTILLGRYDKMGKVQSYCREWARHTGYPLVIIESATHFSNGDNPEQVNAVILRFIHPLRA